MEDRTETDLKGAVPVPLIPLLERARFSPSLSAPATSFVGRERPMRELADLLRTPDVRAVTVVGPGGVGKSRLALRVAETIESDFSDGVVSIDLTGATSADQVALLLAAELGMREAGDRPLIGRIVDFLHQRDVLLLFDNFDRVVMVAPMIAQLLAGASSTTALITSREPLNLSAEWTYRLAPMMTPDPAQLTDAAFSSEAVALFVERARAACYGFAATPGNIAEIGDIVRRLDGLPLAIELAAARLAVISTTTLRERLTRMLPTLSGGARDLPERHQTLRATIAWSFDLLSPAEQQHLCRLALFVSGFTLDGAEAVAQDDEITAERALERVSSLVSRSFLQKNEDGEAYDSRLRMLESVREFALEQLRATGDEEEARDRHAVYRVHLAERADPAIWGGPDHARWLDRLDAELGDFRAALQWLEERGDTERFLRLAAALCGLWHYRSHRIEGSGWLKRALAVAETRPTSALAMAHIKLGMLQQSLGHAEAAEQVTEGLKIRCEIGDQRGIGRAHMNLGNVLKERAEYDASMDELEAAIPILETVRDIGGQATTLMYLGIVHLELGDLDRAAALLNRAIVLHRQDCFDFGVASTLLALGRIDVLRGNVGAAVGRLVESLRLWDEVKSQEGLVDALMATASLAMTNGDQQAAVRLFGSAAVLRSSLGYVLSRRVGVPYERSLAEARKALGDLRFDGAWDAGAGVSRRQAMADALSTLQAISTAAHSPEATDSGAALLTPREQDVLRLLVEGHSDREIAKALGVTYRTVTSYTRNILTKLEVSSRTAAAVEAMRRGLI